MVRARVRLQRSLAAVVAVLALACTSPTLPLPPPAAPTISLGTDATHFKLMSIAGAEPNALIVIVNRREDLPRDQRVSGTIADEHGTWDAVVLAKVGDILDISQESGSSRSAGTTVTVR